MKIMITGANGQLGTDLCERFQNIHDITGVGADILDICNLDASLNIVREIKPDVIINAAAYTNVDGAETNVDKSYLINAIGARNLAIAALESNARLIHISTDFVFDGLNKTMPYNEFDIPNPLNVYGKSKLAGERLIQSTLPRYYIIRTSWLYGQHGTNFVKTVLKQSKTLDRLKVVDDQIGTPTYTHDLIDIIGFLIKTDAYGLYHCSNEGQCSWHAFAKKILEIVGKNTVVDAISSVQLGRPANRPAYSVMDKMMLRMCFGIKLKQWEESLTSFLAGF